MQCLTLEERALLGRGPSSMQERLQVSASWAWRAPGLTSRVLQAWVAWGREQGLWSEVEGRKAMLAKSTQEESWKRHRANDHVPYRKGCPVCVAAQGRQRSHRRSEVQGVFSASFDVAGQRGLSYQAGRLIQWFRP